MRVGIDFGLSVTDAVVLDGSLPTAQAVLLRPGRASVEVVRHALKVLGVDPAEIEYVAVTGGRSRELPHEIDGLPIVVVDEPSAIGRGGLVLSHLDRALVVSCGTGTAMVAANLSDAPHHHGSHRHVSGTPVGGGTLEGLASRLLGVADAVEVFALAQRGSAAGVDTTLGDVLGGGVGTLPPTATAVSFGRLATSAVDAPREDVAAGLVTMIAQTIALVALNTARAEGLASVVCIGRLAEAEGIRRMIEAVFRVYGAPAPHFPEGSAGAIALGAAWSAGDTAAAALRDRA
ncbi:hypothetical protein BH23DEI1_BH23DEI1_24010 [soil metagenome]